MEKPSLNDSFTYLKIIKRRFEDEKEKYREFLRLLKDFKAKIIGHEDFLVEVKVLIDFNVFLPHGYEITLPPRQRQPPLLKKPFEDEAIRFINKVKKKFGGDDDNVYKSFLVIMNKCRKENTPILQVSDKVGNLFRNSLDLWEEFTNFLPDSSETDPRQHDPYGRNSSRLYDGSSAMPTLPQMHKRKRSITSCVDVPNPADRGKAPMKVDHEQRKRTEKGKERKKDRDMKDCDRADRYIEHNSYMDFNNMQPLPHNRKSDQMIKDSISDQLNQESLCNEGNLLRLVMVEDPIKKWERERIDRNKDRDGVTEGERERVRFDRNIPFSNKDVAGHKIPCNKDKHMVSTAELDLSNYQHSTSSYDLLPTNNPIPSASQRTELGADVLKDNRASVTSESKHKCKDQYEKYMLKWEDARFNLDLLLELAKETIKLVEELLDKIKDNTIKSDSRIRMEDHFPAMNLQCIEQIYGEQGLDVVDALQKNPTRVLPVLLTRLEQKQEEWTTWCSRLNEFI